MSLLGGYTHALNWLEIVCTISCCIPESLTNSMSFLSRLFLAMHLPTGKINLGSFLSYSKIATESLKPMLQFDPKAWLRSRKTLFSLRYMIPISKFQIVVMKNQMTALHFGQHLLWYTHLHRHSSWKQCVHWSTILCLFSGKQQITHSPSGHRL